LAKSLIDEDRLIFLICTPRSGSTLVAHALGKTPAIHTDTETWLMLAIEQFGRINPRHEYGAWHVARGVDGFLAGDMDEVLGRFARTAYAEKLPTGKTHFLDKTPTYFWILPFIQRLLPQAKYPVLTRNPLAVAASFKTTWNLDLSEQGLFNNTDIMLSQFFIATEQVQTFAEQQRETKPELVVDYDEFVYQPGRTTERLLRALEIDPGGLGTDAAEVDVRRLNRTGFGDRKILATDRVHDKSRGSWRTALTDIEAALVANYFDLTGPGLDALRRHPGSAARAADLRAYLSEMLEARRSDYRRSYSYDAYDPVFNDTLHALYERQG
jgi:hypothetical protein